MDNRGWGWTVSELRQARLVEWIVHRFAERSAAEYVPVAPFYNALPDQGADMHQIAWNDLQALEGRSLIDLAAGMGGIEGLDVLPTSKAREFTEGLQAMRANKRLRRAASHDAMVDWLYSVDAVSHPGSLRDGMLDDPRRGIWFGEQFSPHDLGAAAAWLERNGLAKGSMVMDQLEGPVRLYLTDAGVKCAEDFGSDTAGYLDKRHQPPPRSGSTVNIGSNSGPVQVAGDNAHQVQNIGASADELRKLITSIAEMVRTLVPDTGGVDDERQAALAAANPGGLDRSVLRRFADWALSTVRAGATAALVPAVSAATNEMLAEAGRLAAHL